MGKRSLFYLAITFFLLIGSVSYAEWVAKGPSGTNAKSLFCSFDNPNAVHVGTNGGDYKTVDLGNSWVYKGLRFRPVNAVGSRQGCNQGLFASGWSDLFSSTDGGDTWNLYATAPEDIKAITRSYAPSCIGYVGTSDRVFVSNKNSGLSGMSVRALSVDSNNNVYAATNANGIYKTVDAGLTWTPVNNGLTTLTIFALKIDSSDRIFAGTLGGGAFLSNDGGSNWLPKNNGLPYINGLPGFYAVTSLAKDGDGNVYAGVITNTFPITGAVYKSSDNGDNWSPTDSAINNYEISSMCVTLGNKLFVGTVHGVYRSDDFGTSWVDMTDEISALPFLTSFVTDTNGTIFIGSDGSGIYKSTNGGQSWVPTGTNDPKKTNDLLIDTLGNMYAAGRDVFGVYKSADNGDTWTLSSNGLPTQSFSGFPSFTEGDSLAMDGNGRIYVGLDDGAVYKTDDNADNWSSTSALPFDGDPLSVVALIGTTGSTIYAGTEGEGIFKSTDGGTTWVKKNNGLPADPEVQEHAFFIDKIAGDIYVGLGNSGLYKSSNGGDNWVNIQPTPDCDVKSVVMDQNGNLYAVVCSGAVFVSRDKGSTWIDISNGLIPWDDVNGINLHGLFADSKNHILLSTESSGMYRLTVFTDVPGTHWAYNYIEALYDNAITTGCSFDGLFRSYCPTSNVTRQAMAAFIIRSLYGENFTYPTTPYFTDVPDTHQFFKYIQKMREMNITTGCTATEYCPGNNVTRQAMAAFIVRAKLGETFPYTSTPYFTDVPNTSQFFKYVQKMKDEDITTGCTATEYCPANNVTRAAMAAFLARAFLGMP